MPEAIAVFQQCSLAPVLYFIFILKCQLLGRELHGYILHMSNGKRKSGRSIKNTRLFICKCMVIEPLFLMLLNLQAQILLVFWQRPTTRTQTHTHTHTRASTQTHTDVEQTHRHGARTDTLLSARTVFLYHNKTKPFSLSLVSGFQFRLFYVFLFPSLSILQCFSFFLSFLFLHRYIKTTIFFTLSSALFSAFD